MLEIQTKRFSFGGNNINNFRNLSKGHNTRFVPEVREQSTMAKADSRIYIFGGLSHDCLGDFLT